MKQYTKPLLLANEDLAEGVYADSGTVAVGETSTGDKTAKCDSQYRQGVWKAPDYSDWNGGTRGYQDQFGCPAYTSNGCGLQTHYVDSGMADSYDVDDGKRKPSWETKGYGPDDTVTDRAMGIG